MMRKILPLRITHHTIRLLIFLFLVISVLIGCKVEPVETAVKPIPTLVATAVPPTLTVSPPTVEIIRSATPTATQIPVSTAIQSPTVTQPPTATQPPTVTPCNQPGRIEHGIFPSAIAGDLSYRIYLPPCYEENGNIYPTLYLLAGNTYTDAIWDQVGLDEAAEIGIQNGDLPPMLIVMPYSGETALYTSGGPGSYETVILEDLTSYIEANYCVDAEPAYRALGGLSRGGYWALEIAFRHPDAFISVGGHSAALLDEYAKPDVNPQYTALANDLGDLRIYLDIGADDWVRENILQLHADMETAVIPHTWVLNEGLHEEAYWEQHVAEYLTWYSEPWSKERLDYPLCPPK
ncbi:MAG: hypothetical protein GWP17_06520 [Aquificales bacterium]|nr:hypothetical protein [Aquificales bacterium]